MENGNTNWSQSVTAVVIYEGKVLLSRHTYGAGKGRLIIPGGYLNHGEMPREALIREYLEETGVLIEPRELIGMRFNLKDCTQRSARITCQAKRVPTTTRTARRYGWTSTKR